MSDMVPYPVDSRVVALEEALKALPGADTSDGNVEHIFAEGLYARKLTIPAGSLIVGKIHLNGQLNFLMQGTICVTTEAGPKTLTAPQIIASPPGTKRAGYAVTETVWVTVSATEETNLAKIEEQIIAKSPEDPRLTAKLEARKCLGQR